MWFTSKVQLVNHLSTFLVAKDLRIDWKSFKISANGDLWILPTHQIEWKIHATKCLRTWNQNMGNVETVIGALTKILIAWNLSQRIQKQFSNLELLGVLPQLLRKLFWNLIVSSVIKRGKRRSKRKVFGQLKPLQCLNVKAGRQCLKLQKIKGTISSYGGSEVLIYLKVKHVFTAAVAGSVRETPLSQTFLNTFSSQVVQRITQQTFKGLWALGMKETTNYFIQRLLLQKNSYKGAMGATRAHTNLHYCETSVQKSRTDYDAE